jgi:hypothetical protein
MSGAPERAGLTSAALCPDGAAGGVVKARFKHFCLGAGKHRAPVGPAHIVPAHGLPTG